MSRFKDREDLYRLFPSTDTQGEEGGDQRKKRGIKRKKRVIWGAERYGGWQDRKGWIPLNIWQQLKWKNSSLESSSLANEDHQHGLHNHEGGLDSSLMHVPTRVIRQMLVGYITCWLQKVSAIPHVMDSVNRLLTQQEHLVEPWTLNWNNTGVNTSVQFSIQ